MPVIDRGEVVMGACRTCGGVGVDANGYCLTCRSYVGPPPKDRTALVVIVSLVGVAVLVLCGIGGGALVWARSRHSDAVAPALPVPVTRPATPTPGPTPTLTGAACVVGRWLETSDQSDATINGVSVRLTSKGAVQTFTADGRVTITMKPVVTKSGRQDGDIYVVSSAGELRYHYQVIGDQLHYSDATASGQTVWQRNGRQIDKQPLKGSLTPDTFTCSGDRMVQYGEGYSIELSRMDS